MEAWQVAIVVKPIALAIFLWAVVSPLRRMIERLIPHGNAKAFLCADYDQPGTGQQKTLAWTIILGFYVCLFTAASLMSR